MPSNHLILCRPLLLPPSIFPRIRVFSNESALLIRWPKYWSFSFSISPSNEHPGLVSFRTDWLDLLAVQGTLKSLLQHHSSKASTQLSYGPPFTHPLRHPSTHACSQPLASIFTASVSGVDEESTGPALSRGHRPLCGSQLADASLFPCGQSVPCCLIPSLAFQQLFNLI